MPEENQLLAFVAFKPPWLASTIQAAGSRQLEGTVLLDGLSGVNSCVDDSPGAPVPCETSPVDVRIPEVVSRVTLKKHEDVPSAALLDVAGTASVSCEVFRFNGGEVLPQGRSVACIAGEWRERHSSQNCAFVIPEDEERVGAPEGVHHASWVWSAMKQITAGDQLVAVSESQLLDQLAELRGATMNVTNDPGRHVAAA